MLIIIIIPSANADVKNTQAVNNKTIGSKNKKTNDHA